MKKMLTLTLTVAVAATMGSPAFAQFVPPIGDALLPPKPELSLTDLLNLEKELLNPISTNKPLYWAPERLSNGAPWTEARCSVGPTVTAFPTVRQGTYAECMAASFPSVDIIDDVSDRYFEPRATGKGPKIYTCKKGNFTGETELGYAREILSNGQTAFVMRTYGYRITKSNDQQGGNKANIKIRSRVNQHGGHWARGESPDSLVQNGNWYTDRGAESHDMRQAAHYFGQIEFVFDKSGADPKCKVEVNWMRPG